MKGMDAQHLYSSINRLEQSGQSLKYYPSNSMDLV
jgi:hypothetical protein